MPKLFDVAIVGLGPVGAILAALLGRQGLEVVVVERSADIFPLPRAIAFDHEAMRVFQNLGLASAIRPFAVPYRPTEYHGVDGALIARYDSPPPPFTYGWAPSFVFTQPKVERIIRQGLTDISSVAVRLSTTLEDLAEKSDHVDLRLSTSSGSMEHVQARYVVGCDGGSSLVRRLLRIDFESLDFDEPWLVVDMLVDEDKLSRVPETIVQYCDPARPISYVIGPGNHRRWEITLLPGETPEAMNREDVIWQLLSRWITPEDGKLWRATTYVFHALVANEWRKGRVLLAGDAAHMTPPFMAQGMCQGIRDAANLAWKLALVVKGRADGALLDTYQQERRPHVRTTTETAKSLGRIICERDHAKAVERDQRLLAQFGSPPKVQFRQNLIPDLIDGALLSEQGPPVGARIPQPRILTQAGEQLLDDYVGSSFRLVVSSELSPEDIPDGLKTSLDRLGATTLLLQSGGVSQQIDPCAYVVVETEGVLSDWLRTHQVVAVLVRPDHYVFGIAREASDLGKFEQRMVQGFCLC